MTVFGEHFDHNLHALRIVETFEQRYARFPGLNLTFEVREGIVKHSRDFERGETPELDEYLPGQRPPLEAQLIDLADEVAYNTADLDDGYSAGMFETADIVEAVPEYGEIYDAVETQFPGATPRERFQEALRQTIDLLASGLIEGTAERALASGVSSAEEVRQFPGRLAGFLPAATSAGAGLKRFLHARVYSSPILIEERDRARARIADLFTLFLAQPERMPEPHAQMAEEQPVHRVVCDYIAGMTDGFFDRSYAQMIG